jgi:hypothetical protein
MRRIILSTLVAILFAGCATTPKINWQARVGIYTYDQAVMQFGPPDKSAKLADGTTVADWITERGYIYATSDYYPFYTRGFIVPPATYTQNRVPDTLLRLTFGADGKLKAWKKFYK